MKSDGTNPDCRVLIVAVHASMRFGGEASLPVHWFRGLRARGIEAWLLVHERTREELRELLGADIERVHFAPDRRLHKLLWRMGRRIPARIRTFTTELLIRLTTQMDLRRRARALVSEHRIDIVHEPIPVSPRLPSLMHGLGAPVIIGPLNGGMTYPKGFRDRESRLERWFIGFGRLFADLGNRLIRGKRRAAMVLVANERTRRALPRGCRDRVAVLCENGVDLALWDEPARSAPGESPVRFVFLGRLVDWKCVDVLVEAFARLRSGGLDAELWLIGDGPERPLIESRIAELGLEHHVTIHGWVPQPECPALLRQCDVLVLPSAYECGGAVVLEAMALGMPAIATNWGGPTDYITDDVGVLVDPTSREGLIDGFVDAMRRLGQSAELRRRMGEAGRRRVVEDFDWRQKVSRMLEIFAAVVGDDDDTHVDDAGGEQTGYEATSAGPAFEPGRTA